MWLYRMHYSLRAPSALLFRLTLTKKSIHLSLHMRFEVTASEPNITLHLIQPHGIEPIIPLHCTTLTPKRRSFPKSHDPNGLFDKISCKNAILLLQI